MHCRCTILKCVFNMSTFTLSFVSFEFTSSSPACLSFKNIKVGLVRPCICLPLSSYKLGMPCILASYGTLNYGKDSIGREMNPCARTSKKCDLSYSCSCRRRVSTCHGSLSKVVNVRYALSYLRNLINCPIHSG